MGRQVQARTRLEPETISPNPKTNLKLKSCPKKNESQVMSKKFSNIAALFYFFGRQRQKVSLRPDIFVNVRPEPGPKSPARLTTLSQIAM